MKKAVVILLVFALLMFCGCVSSTENTGEESMFVIVEDAYLWDVVYHRDTKVMYVISYGYSNTGDFCVLVNPDGTPMLWEGGADNGN